MQHGRVLVRAVFCVPDCSLCPHVAERSTQATNAVHTCSALMTSSNATTSQRPHLPIPSHWGVGFQCRNFEGVTNIRFIKRPFGDWPGSTSVLQLSWVWGGGKLAWKPVSLHTKGLLPRGPACPGRLAPDPRKCPSQSCPGEQGWACFGLGFSPLWNLSK